MLQEGQVIKPPIFKQLLKRKTNTAAGKCSNQCFGRKGITTQATLFL
jgi:hypothetical protein